MLTDVESSNAARTRSAQFNQRERLVEVCVFLLLIMPSMILSFFAVRQGDVSFVLATCSTILRDLALVSLILLFMWRNGEPVEQLGWTFKHAWKEIAVGIMLFIPFFYAALVLESILRALGFSAPATSLPSFLAARGVPESVLAFVLVTVVAVAEETIFRGYLILRFRALTASPTLAVLVSAVIFAIGHGYEGAAGVITVGTMGVIFALVYSWRQSLVAPMVMHFLQDFLVIVLIPLLRALR